MWGKTSVHDSSSARAEEQDRGDARAGSLPPKRDGEPLGRTRRSLPGSRLGGPRRRRHRCRATRTRERNRLNEVGVQRASPTPGLLIQEGLGKLCRAAGRGGHRGESGIDLRTERRRAKVEDDPAGRRIPSRPGSRLPTCPARKRAVALPVDLAGACRSGRAVGSRRIHPRLRAGGPPGPRPGSGVVLRSGATGGGSGQFPEGIALEARSRRRPRPGTRRSTKPSGSRQWQHPGRATETRCRDTAPTSAEAEGCIPLGLGPTSREGPGSISGSGAK